MKLALLCGLVAACVGLMGCTEKPQTASQRKADTRAFQGPDDGYTAPGWKIGDEASWEAQMKTRAQGQNEYSRASAP
jgi:hypothetical protein